MMGERRAIQPEEAEVIRVTIEKAAVRTVSPEAMSSIPELTVIGRCECGCTSVDFDDPLHGESTVIADGIAKTPAGGEVGVMVWGRPDAITALEIYDLGAGDNDLRLPAPRSIEPWPRGRSVQTEGGQGSPNAN